MSTKKAILIFSIVVATALMATCLLVTVDRLNLEYSETGVYFDEEALTTYDSQAVVFYGGATVILLFLTTALFLKLRKAHSH